MVPKTSDKEIGIAVSPSPVFKLSPQVPAIDVAFKTELLKVVIEFSSDDMVSVFMSNFLPIASEELSNKTCSGK
ncbi:hypothetical protein DNK47_02585 [Mycoplasma wenyonii]|uniref:Uncharacterized protein n=1 Tax=Mycoplasma wenyonii TaxID=65123 RepID=A0A328PRF5_9MOLU|nr:hypothetical protein DNK47_02585 [Mycoplasma wenyonii]